MTLMPEGVNGICSRQRGSFDMNVGTSKVVFSVTRFTPHCRAEPVDFVKESRVYLDYICKIQRGEPAMPSPAQPVHMGEPCCSH